MTGKRYAYSTSTTIQIVAHWCGGCGLPYGLPEGYLEARREDHQSWTCPNGCVRHFAKGSSKAEVLQQQLEAARSLAERESERRRAAEGQRAAARGEVTQLRKRVGNGVCPCCNRTFADLGQHMAGQHPEFRLDEEEPNPTLKVDDLSPNQVWTLQTLAVYLNQGQEGAETMWFHRATVGALVRRCVVTVEDDVVVPTATGLRLIAAAGSAS